MRNERRADVRQIVNRPAKFQENPTALLRECTISDIPGKGVRLSFILRLRLSHNPLMSRSRLLEAKSRAEDLHRCWHPIIFFGPPKFTHVPKQIDDVRSCSDSERTAAMQRTAALVESRMGAVS